MEVAFLGHSSFRLKGKNITLITDPFDPSMVGLKYPSVEADLVTISHHHADHSFKQAVQVNKMVIDGPGEYEIGGVSIIGMSTYHDDKKGEVRGKNTVYLIEMDGVKVAHLGDLGHTLSQSQLETIGQVDVLLIPVGGEYTIGPEDAVRIVHEIQPGIIIPMHYQMPGLNKETFDKLLSVEEFTKIMGKDAQTLPKLNVKQGEVLEGEEKIIVLEKKT